MNPEDRKSYRASLQVLMEKMQSEYDKTVLVLSGGAFGLSMSFTKDLVGKDQIHFGDWLLAAWLFWGTSVGAILASFFTSAKAMERAIRQIDQHAVYREPVGGYFDKMTRYLNATAGLLFFFGLIAMTLFVRFNIK